MDAQKFIRMRQVSEITGVAQSTIFQWQREGRFIKPLKIGPKCSVYRLQDVLDWVEAAASAGRG